MTWTIRDAERDRATTDAIDQLDDRGAAILAGALLEDRLTIAIKARLISDPKVMRALFTGMGPLATFSAKIKLAYLMSIIPKPISKCADTVRKIRNEFAHNLSPLTFETPQIKALCGDLPFTIDVLRTLHSDSLVELENDPKILNVISFWFSPLLDLPNTARTCYMNSIKYMLISIELGTIALEEKSSLTLVGSETKSLTINLLRRQEALD
jgi:hypothetical protein